MRDAGARPARRGRRLAVPDGDRQVARRAAGRRRGRQLQRAAPVLDRRDRRRRSPVCGCCRASTCRSTRRCCAGAVETFRPHVAAAGIDASRLVGRWVPNVLARPFADGDDVVELLARQLASPVRWIETQQALAGRVDRFLEIAPAARRGPDRPRADDRRRRRAAARRERPRHACSSERRCPPRRRCPPGRTRPLAHLHPSRGRRIATGPSTRATRCVFVLALQARVRLDQVEPGETLDELFQGVSSRRNQVLIDLGREFGLSGGEGVQRQTIGELVKTLREQGAAYRFPGPYLREALAAGPGAGGRAARRAARPRARADAARARAGRARHAARPVGARRRARAARGRPGRARTRAGAHRRRPRRRAGAARRGAGRGRAGRRRPAARGRAARLRSRRLARQAGEPSPSPTRDSDRLAILDAELGAERARGDRAALRRPPPRALRVGVGERALGPRDRLPRRRRRPDRTVRRGTRSTISRRWFGVELAGAASRIAARPSAPVHARSMRRGCRSSPHAPRDVGSRRAASAARPARRDGAGHRRVARVDRGGARAAAAARRARG